MKKLNNWIETNPKAKWILLFSVIVITFLLGLFAASIMERRAEAQFVFTPKVKYDQLEPKSVLNLWSVPPLLKMTEKEFDLNEFIERIRKHRLTGV